MKDQGYEGTLNGTTFVVMSSAAFSRTHILDGIRAEILDETVVTPGTSSFAYLTSEPYKEHVDVLPSVWGRGLFEGSPDVVVRGFLGH